MPDTPAQCLACARISEHRAPVDLGHDAMAHRIYAVLARKGITTTEALATIPDVEIIDWRNLGAGALRRIRALVPAPEIDPDDLARPPILPRPCSTCTQLAARPDDPRWRHLLTHVDLGHDRIAHRTYTALVANGVTAEQVAGLTDDQILAMRSFGAGMLARIRSYFPTSGAGSVEKLTTTQWCARYELILRDTEGWSRVGASLTTPINLPLFWSRFSGSSKQIPPAETWRRIRADVRDALELLGAG